MSQQHILQVSELTKKVRFLLENELNTVWLCGEISNFIAAGSGHWYLSLKDSKSQVRCAMFKGNNRRVRLKPTNGQQVLVRARVSLYEPRGDFQLIIEQMEDAGDGLLRQQFELLKNKLYKQGLFDDDTKKPIPSYIKTVGIITSATGAAVKDILTVLKRRNPTINAIIYPCLVQGELASQQVEKAINIANKRNECDVLIIGRGGGSLEDLWCFNEERVVRAIHQSVLPTISAVGHEIDTTLSDYVADLRAPTPSAAAELVSTDIIESHGKIVSLTNRLRQNFQHQFKFYQKTTDALLHRLSRVHPQQRIATQQQKADQLNIRLKQVIDRELSRFKQLPTQLNRDLFRYSPHHKIEQKKIQLAQLEHQLTFQCRQKLKIKQQKFAHLVEELHIVSPLATLARGYSVVRSSKGKVVNTTTGIEIGEQIGIQVNDGNITATVVCKELNKEVK